MKAPVVAELTQSNQSENKPVTGDKKPKEVIIATEKERPKAKSYTLHPRYLRYINTEVIKLTNERGTAVNASEALRVILDRDMERSK
ncbi:hypothetical protein [Aquimarina macrocephali]|uniref:hypothetical protein n=1 Tax=Aquimarina macrocephali TaxID=666563 RepID=UPI000465C683|nr:hypothetical protein [Aquimarina macrocephali]